jgi:hypothetical protein
VVFEVGVESVGSWNALKMCFPGGLEVAAQRILEECVSFAVVCVEGIGVACGKEDGQCTEKTFLVGCIGTKWQDHFLNDVGVVIGGTMFNFHRRVLVVGLIGLVGR